MSLFPTAKKTTATGIGESEIMKPLKGTFLSIKACFLDSAVKFVFKNILSAGLENRCEIYFYLCVVMRNFIGLMRVAFDSEFSPSHALSTMPSCLPLTACK